MSDDALKLAAIAAAVAALMLYRAKSKPAPPAAQSSQALPSKEQPPRSDAEAEAAAYNARLNEINSAQTQRLQQSPPPVRRHHDRFRSSEEPVAAPPLPSRTVTSRQDTPLNSMCPENGYIHTTYYSDGTFETTSDKLTACPQLQN